MGAVAAAARRAELQPPTGSTPTPSWSPRPAGNGVDAFVTRPVLPPGPGARFYPEEDLTDLPMPVHRQGGDPEKLSTLLEEEIPYIVAVQIRGVQEADRRKLVRIRADVLVERESQKGTSSGKGGGS